MSTDHKNLKYLQEAKTLNPCQAKWALFFTFFNFSISYHPGTKNFKVDALACLLVPKEANEEPEPILPPPMALKPLRWGVHKVFSMSLILNAPH